jgi:hypothetical protein
VRDTSYQFDMRKDAARDLENARVAEFTEEYARYVPHRPDPTRKSSLCRPGMDGLIVTFPPGRFTVPTHEGSAFKAVGLGDSSLHILTSVSARPFAFILPISHPAQR